MRSQVFLHQIKHSELAIALLFMCLESCTFANKSSRSNGKTPIREVRYKANDCVGGLSSSIDSINGCPGFVLVHDLEDIPECVVVVEGDPNSIEYDYCHSFSINERNEHPLGLNIRIDQYIDGGFRKAYCSCLKIANAEEPVVWKCVKGDVTLIKENTETSKHTLLTIFLQDVKFQSERNDEEITLEKVVFDKVLISQW